MTTAIIINSDFFNDIYNGLKDNSDGFGPAADLVAEIALSGHCDFHALGNAVARVAAQSDSLIDEAKRSVEYAGSTNYTSSVTHYAASLAESERECAAVRMRIITAARRLHRAGVIVGKKPLFTIELD